ncbi:1-phosphofructokinase [Ectobacillus polymachus]|uniref:1-phosphofructokinase n=1 Tax=Ectobacillus polymachus TaxID=1508806 RepID=UPI003A86203E
MIYTVTLNPSVDYVIHVSQFEENKLNRMKSEAKFPGGKGINVSRILKRLDVPTKALGFIGGFTGGFILDELEKEEVQTDFVTVHGDSRINIKLKSVKETEINGEGPLITEEQANELVEKINNIPNESFLVLAGSIPASLPNSFYKLLTRMCSNRGVKVAVDASGKVLLDVVQYHPFLIKPNHHELGDLFDITISSVKEAEKYGRRLVEMGAVNVIVSMAGEGALLLTEDESYYANVPKGKVVNSVGAGDSLVASFLGTYVKTNDVVESFRFGVAAGSATAFSSDLATKEKIEELVSQVTIQTL